MLKLLLALLITGCIVGAMVSQPLEPTPAQPLPGAPAATDSIKPLDGAFLRDYVLTGGYQRGRPLRARPTPDSKSVLFLRSQPQSGKLALHELDIASKQVRELLTAEQLLAGDSEKLTPEEKARRERMRLSAAGIADYQLSKDGRLILVQYSGKLFVYDRTTAQARELKTGPGVILDPKFAPNGKLVGYVLNHDVFVYDLATDRETRLTEGGSEMRTNGLAEFVAQEEMHRYAGFWFSPDSQSIAYEEADHQGVEVWYVADPSRPDAPPQKQYYPRPGKQNVQVRLGIVGVAGGPTQWIDWDRQQYEYLAAVDWLPEGLYVTVQNRLQTELVVLKVVDAADGRKQTQPLLTERDPCWVNLFPDNLRPLPDQQGFLRLTDTPEGTEIVQYRLNGQRVARFAPPGPGKVYASILAIAPDQTVYALHKPDPTQTQVVRFRAARPDAPGPANPAANAEAADWKVIVGGERGMHTASFAPDQSFYIRTSTTPKHMPRTTVHRSDGQLIAELPSLAKEPPILPNVEFRLVEAKPGLHLHTATVRPRNFDPTKRYPVVVDVYGGPGHTHVVSAMRNWLIDQWLADQGFIVVAIDGRGTPGRGRDWERAIYQKFGSVPLDDQVAGLQALAAQVPQMDLKRVGIVGWSFGGYLSALAVLKRPDVFHAGIAGAPVCDWEDYDTHYTERFMGLPRDATAAYKDGNLLTHAPKLARPLLIVHGTADDNVYFRHALRLCNGLFRAGKHYEFMPMPGFAHGVSGPGVTERLWERYLQFFRQHLGQPTP